MITVILMLVRGGNNRKMNYKVPSMCAIMEEEKLEAKNGRKTRINEILNDPKKMMQIVTVLIMAMAAVTGAVSQEITNIQNDAAAKESEAQNMFAESRALEASENQILLREEILMTEAQSQATLASTLMSERSSIGAEVDELEEEYYLSALRSEIDTYYLRGSELFRMEWSEGLLIDMCYTGTDAGLHSQCQADLVFFEGTDVVSDAVQISFTFDESLGDGDPFNKMLPYLLMLENEYDGFYQPLISSTNSNYYLQIQFPLFYSGSEVFESGDGLMWQNEGLQFNLEWTNSQILDIKADIDICESYYDYYFGWKETHKFNAEREEALWLAHAAMAESWYAAGHEEGGDNYTEVALEYLASRNDLMNQSNENSTIAHGWAVRLLENTTALDTHQAWFDSEQIYLDSALSDLEKSIADTEALVSRYSELTTRSSQLDLEIELSTELKLELSKDTAAYQLGYLSLEDARFPDNESRISFEQIIHFESNAKFGQAEELQQEVVSIRSGLESISLSILFISSGNLLFGVSGGMMKEKRLGSEGSDRNVLLVFAVGCLSSIVGLFMYIA